MINKRKKKIDVRSDFENLKSSQNRLNIQGFRSRRRSSEEDIGDFEDLRSSLNSKLGGELDKQVSNLQTQAEDRAAAEESNLDILDRGSRYVRKNEKLKKFKV